MKIKSIHIYSHDGQRRDLELKVDGLNVITGRSSTGKSALSEIVELLAAIREGVFEPPACLRHLFVGTLRGGDNQ